MERLVMMLSMRVFMDKLDVADVVNMIIMLPSPFIAIWSMIVCYKTVDQLESVFESSRLVMENKAWMNKFGFAGKVWRCGAILAICMYPGPYVRDGSVVEEEVLAIPKALKRKLYPPFVICTVWSVALIGWSAFGW
jgi:hypothetical protein